MLLVSCGGLVGGSAQKVVINEGVCATSTFLRMNVGEETKIVLDNTQAQRRAGGHRR